MVATCVDATQEELFHAITQYGYAKAYKKIFGELPPTLNSKIQLAMDKARYEWVLERVKGVMKTQFELHLVPTFLNTIVQ